MQAKTLLQMAGAVRAPARLSDAVLVIIDAQNEYVDGLLALPGVALALEATARLLDRARKAGAPVIHVVHQGSPGGAFAPGSRGAAIADAAAPIAGEPVVAKRLPNAFAATNLLETLQALGKTDVILAGFMTHMCVESTARASIDLGLKATIVASATATRDLPDPLTGTAVPAAEVQRNALAALSDRFAVIAPTVDAIGN